MEVKGIQKINSLQLKNENIISDNKDHSFKIDLHDSFDGNNKINLKDSLTTNFKNFINEWQRSEKLFSDRLKTMAPENRKLIELQVSVNKLNLQSNIAVQVGEGISNSIKRLHQMGSN